MTERSPGVWRLQVTSDPDAVTGRTRRLSRTFRGTKADAKRALEAFISSASGVVVPVVSIDGAPVGDGAPGPITLSLRAAYFEGALR